MSVVYLMRLRSDEQGTLGSLMTPGGYTCLSLELPDRNNRPNLSRIPVGEYRCTWHRSPRFGWVYWVRNVPGRSAVLIHPGNLAGDTTRGLKTHSHGCLLLGKHVGRLNGQRAVLASRPAIRDFCEVMNQKDFTLKIMEADNVGHVA